MRLARHDILVEPMEVRGKQFRNRFYAVPHGSFHPGRRLSDIAFRRTKAEGGWAAVCGGVVSLHEESWGGFVPRIWDEEDRAVLGRMAAEIRGQGALAGIEFGHGGGRGSGAKFLPSLGPTQRPDPANGRVVPKAMDLDDIGRVQDDYVGAATTAADLGYDIVYAYGAHGYLPGQFLSPWFNRRTDRYGGSLENRGRFWLELIDRMRAAVGDRCLVAVRIAAEAFSPYGVSADETLDFVEMVDDLVDLWDVNVGDAWATDSAEWRVAPEGFQVEYSRRFRERTRKPIVGVSRLTTPDAMASILHDGSWDFIGAARPSIADPFLPSKIAAGRYDEIRECTGSNFCIAVETTGIGLSCVQNPTIGEEYRRRWHPEVHGTLGSPRPTVLVVGAGPAGLECARILGERGATVHVVDAGPAVGGHVRWLRRVPGMGGLGRVIDYRILQLRRLGDVATAVGRSLSATDVMDYGAQVVVLATGSRWIGAGDADLDPVLVTASETGIAVLTPEDVMEAVDGAADRVVGPVVVWDAEGSGVASGIAEQLARTTRAAVTIATPFTVVSPVLDASFAGDAARRSAHDSGVRMITGVRPVGTEGGRITLRDAFDREVSCPIATLVVAAARRSDDGLYRELRTLHDRWSAQGINRVVRIGDCVTPRPLGLVVADGHRVGREVDSPDVSVPLPTRPERDREARTAVFG